MMYVQSMYIFLFILGRAVFIAYTTSLSRLYVIVYRLFITDLSVTNIN